ncbi:MAG: cytochrome c oxidase subunit II [Candidatus Omnitrophica bacterium]|nr:cytochrome c oxidase subunit II [Candidatus Omnitrophota bacterium]
MRSPVPAFPSENSGKPGTGPGTIVALCAVLAGALLSPASAWAFGGSGVRVWLPEAVTTTAPEIDRLFYVILGITGAVFLLVEATLLVFVVRYRHRPGRRAAYTHGSHVVEIVWTVIPALILVYLTFHSQSVWARIRGAPPPPDLEVEITAEQFAWNIRYAGPDGVLGSADDLLTLNQLHLPIHQAVLLHLKSKDVIHSFFVPQFRMKQDAVPGLTTRLWLSATASGQYEIVCAELCGLGHYRMRGFLTLEPAEAFQQWLAAQAPQQEQPS